MYTWSKSAMILWVASWICFGRIFICFELQLTVLWLVAAGYCSRLAWCSFMVAFWQPTNGWFRCRLPSGVSGGQRDAVGIGYAEQMSSTLDNENAGNSLTAQRISGLFFSFGWLVSRSLIFELNSQMIDSVFPPIVIQRCNFKCLQLILVWVAFIC